MAVVRVKRSCSDEPLDILLLACKKIKTEESIPETSVFKFAATVSNQEDTSLHFTLPFKNDAESIIKRESKRVEEIRRKLRDEHELFSKNSRYKVVNCYRSLNEDDFKHENDEAESIDKRGLTILDVESHGSKENENGQSNTFNSAGSNYVYDLYYTTGGADLDDLQLEHVHSVHPVNSELMFESYRDNSDTEENFDDEDDSNDEDNWRNEYPDEEDVLSDDEGGAYGGENDDDDDGKRFVARFSNCRIGDEEDDLSSEDEDFSYNNILCPSDVQNFGESYAKYKARINGEEYDSTCSVKSNDST